MHGSMFGTLPNLNMTNINIKLMTISEYLD